MELKPATVKQLLETVSAAPDTDRQGKAYEELAAYLFECIPGCIIERNTITFFHSEQVDLGVGNDKHADGLTILPHVIIVECKDWSRPVDSKTLGYFINLLRNRSAEVGILIAANGITGDKDELTNAHSLGAPAMADKGIKVLVITTPEIAALTCTADLVDLLKRRFLRAIMANGIGIGP
jgi:hypothetical protein